MQLDDTPLTQHKRVLDDVLQFPHVPGVGMFHQPGKHVVRYARNLRALQLVELRDDVLDEQRNILAALRQAGQPEMNDADPIVQVFAKRPRTHQVGQVFVRGRHHAHIDGHRLDTS